MNDRGQVFTGDDVDILERRSAFRGFFEIAEYRLRHRLFRGGWSRDLKRELFVRGPVVAVLLYDPERDLVFIPLIALDHARHKRLTLIQSLGQFNDLDRSGPVGEAADKAPLFQRRDQPVNARLGAQIKRVLHFIERRRNAVALHTFVNELQQIQLLTG